jgi:maleylacetoacetate isomerase
MKLYGYFRSSTSYRVRIALALKGLACEHAFVHLLRGDQNEPEYLAINPQGRVPALEVDGEILIQSPAILEYLEDAHPSFPLLPGDEIKRARIRAVCAILGCDVHPLNNLSTLKYLKNVLGVDDEARNAWYAHWVTQGLDAVEQLIEPGPYCFGSTPTMADVYLIPQVFNAQRFNVPMDAYPKIGAVASACEEHPAFQAAAPDAQPDAA